MLVLDLAVILALVMLGVQMTRPWDGSPGRVVHRQRLSLLGRLRMFGRWALAIALLVIGAKFAGWITLWAMIAALAALVVLMALPVDYTLTNEGIRLGRAPLRRWTEFGGVRRQRWNLRLQGVAGNTGMTVWLSGNRDDDDFAWLLRQMVRGAYQGHPAAPASNSDPVSPIMPGAAASAM